MSWRDYPSLRTVLVRRLSALVSDHDASVRIGVAETVGLLATHDLDHMAETPLRRSRTATYWKRVALS